MASTPHILLCGLAAAMLWTALGLPVAQRLFPRQMSLPIAPALGWAMHSAAALPIHMVIGMSRPAVAAQLGLSLAIAAMALLRRQRLCSPERPAAGVPAWAYAAAALLALGPAIAVFPRAVGDGIALAAPIFDHSKVAMIDEMVRLGVPPGNPFFGEAGGLPRLSYYYLWHFSAAELASLTGVTGWEADAGLSWFTAFASLALMMGLATALGERKSAAALVILLAATASMRPLLARVLGMETYAALLEPASGFGGWLFQASWAPQHVMSACCVVLAVMLIAHLRRRGPLPVSALVLVVVAGYESSVWVGGVLLAVAAPPVGLVLLWRMAPTERTAFIGRAALAAACAGVIASPFLHDQYVAAAARGAGVPIAIQAFPVLGAAFPEAVRRALDVPAYWLVHLAVEFPAIYPAGAIALVLFARRRTLSLGQGDVVVALASLTVASLLVGALGASTIAENNDLGWRAVLPGVILLTVFAAAGLSQWLSRPASRLWPLAAAGIMLGLPEGLQLVYGNAFPRPAESAAVFARTPGMWEAVRRHSSGPERVGNNPRFLRDLTPWPVNISWALMSNRRSCYAGLDLVIPLTSLTPERRNEIDARFARVFDGAAETDDVAQLASRYDCRLVAITAQDGAWERDPLATSPFYRLVDSDPAGWRLYRAVAVANR